MQEKKIETFAERLSALRRSKQLTQKMLSDKTGIPKRTIEEWENARRTPSEWVQRLVISEISAY